MPKKLMEIEGHQLTGITVAIALDEAVIRKLITDEARQYIEARADDFMKALVAGKVLDPNPDGTYTIMERTDADEAEIADLTPTLEIGGKH